MGALAKQFPADPELRKANTLDISPSRLANIVADMAPSEGSQDLMQVCVCVEVMLLLLVLLVLLLLLVSLLLLLF